MKPHKGTIINWWARGHEFAKGLGYIICGEFVDHPVFAGQKGHTSYVISHDEATGEIETLNSRYTLKDPIKDFT